MAKKVTPLPNGKRAKSRKVKTAKQRIVDLLSRPEGATLEDLNREIGWKSMSSALGRTCRGYGLIVEKEKVDGVTRYFARKPKQAA